ncbi:MAG TPA: flagellar motor protein MotB [Longimicrobiaceae bacterium]
MSDRKKSVIVIKKVRKKHGAHHGGSWKVAYADFVTAMMAFFMVMWILGMDSDVRKAIQGYFTNPVGMDRGYSSGVSPIATGTSPAAVKTPQPLRLITRGFEEERFRELAARIQARLREAEGLREIAAQIEVVITKDGLRIELVEGGNGEMFFALGSSKLKPAAARALAAIATELKETQTPLVVEGHTDAAPFGPGRRYSNWELSVDRANAARQAMAAAGLGDHRIREIRGYADRTLRNPDNPLDPANRRISILLPFSSEPPAVRTTVAEG